MPRSIEEIEIVKEVLSAEYTSASYPLLNLCRELATDGRFEELASSVSVWISKLPESNTFVKARVPAIILNSYLVRLEILSFAEFLRWEKETDWAEKIRTQADNPVTLPTAVDSIVSSMRSFKRANA
jgi:hypothetical protein